MSLLADPLESTSEAYAVAKIAGIAQVQSYRHQYRGRWISAMPTNLYGPGDNFDLRIPYVLPTLIRECHDAASRGYAQVMICSGGTPRRECFHVDDLASACLFLLEHHDVPEPINIGAGTDISIRDLTDLVPGIVGFSGDIALDTSKPDGTPHTDLDISRLAASAESRKSTIATGSVRPRRGFAEKENG